MRKTTPRVKDQSCVRHGDLSLLHETGFKIEPGVLKKT